MIRKAFKLSVISSMVVGFLTGCQLTSSTKSDASLLPVPMFKEVTNDFPRAEKNLRQWDTPVVADLDQDGYPDLLMNDHGFSLRVMWNNKGNYSKPYDLIMGDMHGISVADFDKDGNQEIIISRGGGSGSNARNSIIYRVNKNRKFTVVPDFKEPLAFMRGRTVKFTDADNDGDLDLLNFAFPSKEMIQKDKSESYIYENNGTELILNNVLPTFVKADGQKTLLTDFNGDNVIDLLIYGHDYVRAFQGQGDLTFKQVTKSVLPTKYRDVNGIAEIDYDNDGDFDIVMTRGHEFVAGETFFNEQTKTLGFYTKRGKFTFDGLKVGDVMNIENLQSQWPNKALYLGESAYEYMYPGETHSGRDVRLVNSDTLGFPDTTEKKGTYLGYVGNQEWRLVVNMFSPSSGILHGVESYPAYDHKPGLSDILLENVNGKYVDVSVKAGLVTAENNMAIAIADVDNNGFQDIVIAQRGNIVTKNESVVYLNTGKKTFEENVITGLISTELGARGMGIEPVDYNKDGRVDFVQGNERGKWHLFKNTFDIAAKHNFVTVNVGTLAQDKVSALGALVNIEACGNSQVKRVGSSGATYSLSFDQNVHFGLGQCQEVSKVTVTWSNNVTQQAKAIKANTILNIGQFN
ncbi:CRTAC1 family protein [Colwellia sp. UCD-KL20]|uniref:CRTAC1 family protein n=1 Tax=Colwellia sp. UCD-KL20 TaxID=1917165 RepID=UPI00097103D8|nr:CRTAC1 family protein [Colwellia sp. UCD-KL20]